MNCCQSEIWVWWTSYTECKPAFSERLIPVHYKRVYMHILIQLLSTLTHSNIKSNNLSNFVYILHELFMTSQGSCQNQIIANCLGIFKIPTLDLIHYKYRLIQSWPEFHYRPLVKLLLDLCFWCTHQCLLLSVGFGRHFALVWEWKLE